MARKSTKIRLDTMSVTVLLVMSIFGGIIGFYLGRGAMTAQTVTLKEAAVLMKDNGSLMTEAGKLMDANGKRTGNTEMTTMAKSLLDGGTVLMGKANSLTGILP